MVVSRPRIDELVDSDSSTLTTSDVAKASRRENGKQNNKNGARNARSRRRRPHRPQQRHQIGRDNLPDLDENDAAYSIHEEMSARLRRFDDFRDTLQSGGIHILIEAENVLDKYLSDAIAAEGDDDQLNEWIVYYATKIIRCYLHLERRTSGNQSPRGSAGQSLQRRKVSKSNDALHRADELLRRLEKRFGYTDSDNSGGSLNSPLPWMDTAAALVSSSYLREQVYNHLIGAYTKRSKLCSYGRNDSGSSLARQYIAAAESILQRMTDPDSTLVAPDAKSYGLILSAHARRGDADAASSLLGMMEARCDKDDDIIGGRSAPRPGVICYNAVLNAYARAARPHDAMTLIDRMGDRAVQPDVVSYTSLLDGWARWLESTSSARSEFDDATVMQAMEHAEGIMSKLENTDGGPNVVAYNAMLKVYLNGAKLMGKIDAKSSVDTIGSATISSSNPLLPLAEKTRSVFRRMSRTKVYPNFITYSCAVHEIGRAHV